MHCISSLIIDQDGRDSRECCQSCKALNSRPFMAELQVRLHKRTAGVAHPSDNSPDAAHAIFSKGHPEHAGGQEAASCARQKGLMQAPRHTARPRPAWTVISRRYYPQILGPCPLEGQEGCTVCQPQPLQPGLEMHCLKQMCHKGSGCASTKNKEDLMILALQGFMLQIASSLCVSTLTTCP